METSKTLDQYDDAPGKTGSYRHAYWFMEHHGGQRAPKN